MCQTKSLHRDSRLECHSNQSRDQIEVAIIAKNWEFEFECDRGDPEIVGWDGGSIGFEEDAKVRVVIGRDFGDGMDFRKRKVFLKPFLIAASVA
jgi:hypothetical protein